MLFSRKPKTPEWVAAKMNDPLEDRRVLLAAQATAYSKMPTEIAGMSHLLAMYVHQANAVAPKRGAGGAKLGGVKQKMRDAEQSVIPPDDNFEHRWETYYEPWVEIYLRKAKAHQVLN